MNARTTGEDLLAFYRAYAAWLDAGAPSNGVFARWNGLCDSVYNWCKHMRFETDRATSMHRRMRTSFMQADLNSAYPFNISPTDFRNEAYYESMHTNQERVAWVRARVAEGAG